MQIFVGKGVRLRVRNRLSMGCFSMYSVSFWAKYSVRVPANTHDNHNNHRLLRGVKSVTLNRNNKIRVINKSGFN